jgi:hypothetical protein
MAKYKITPLARFFFFMIIAAPLLFLLATYMTGERKYLNQVIEWVQPGSVEEAAATFPEETESTDSGNKTLSNQTLDSNQAGKEIKADSTAGPSEEKALSLSDSLELLKRQLRECKNK